MRDVESGHYLNLQTVWDGLGKRTTEKTKRAYSVKTTRHEKIKNHSLSLDYLGSCRTATGMLYSLRTLYVISLGMYKVVALFDFVKRVVTTDN